MENRDRIINWISISLSQAPNSLTESFYFDHKKQIFFSIHAVDYFMLNENLEIDPSVKASYSKENQQEIEDWVKRLEENDSSIIRVPQKGFTDDKLKEIDAIAFINENKIDCDKAILWEVESKVSIGFDLTKDKEIKKPQNKKWWEFWK